MRGGEERRQDVRRRLRRGVERVALPGAAAPPRARAGFSRSESVRRSFEVLRLDVRRAKLRPAPRGVAHGARRAPQDGANAARADAAQTRVRDEVARVVERGEDAVTQRRRRRVLQEGVRRIERRRREFERRSVRTIAAALGGGLPPRLLRGLLGGDGGARHGGPPPLPRVALERARRAIERRVDRRLRRALERPRELGAEVHADAPEARGAVPRVFLRGGERGAVLEPRKRRLEVREVLVDARRAPLRQQRRRRERERIRRASRIVDADRVSLGSSSRCGGGRGLGRVRRLGLLVLVREDGPVLRDDVEDVGPGGVGASSEKVARVRSVELVDAVANEPRAASEEDAAQDDLVVRGVGIRVGAQTGSHRAPQVADDAEALGERRGRAELGEEARDGVADGTLGASADQTRRRDGVRGGDELGDVRLQVEGLVVVPVAHARVLQGGDLERVEEGGLVGGGVSVFRPGARDVRRLGRERLAPGAERREGRAHRLEAALDPRHLPADRGVALRGADEGAVVLHRGLARAALRALALGRQPIGLLVQALDAVAEQIAQVRVVRRERRGAVGRRHRAGTRGDERRGGDDAGRAPRRAPRAAEGAGRFGKGEVGALEGKQGKNHAVDDARRRRDEDARGASRAGNPARASRGKFRGRARGGAAQGSTVRSIAPRRFKL